MDYVALIPAYEPDYKLIKLVDELYLNKFKIVVVNDGSGFSFNDVFDKIKKKATVIGYESNKGKGVALKTGIKYINKNYQDYIIVTMDCDGQHKVSDALKLCDKAKEEPDTLILGKRLRKKSTPLRSRLGNSITHFVFKLATKIDIYDTQTGLRAFSKALVPFIINVTGSRFEYEMNVLIQCAHNNIPIKEVDIETIYYDNNKQSHFNTLKDSYLIYKDILKFTCSSFVSFVIDYILYALFYFFTKSVVFANVTARVFSSTFNYNINRTLVFKSNKNVRTTALEYFTLAIIILVGNTLVVNVLSQVINVYIAKVITEVLFYSCSWLVQRYIIFRRKE